MITKQLITFQQKTEKGSEIIAIYVERCEHKKKLIALVDSEIEKTSRLVNQGLEKNILQLKIQRLDILESLVENQVSLKIKQEIQAEDLRAYERISLEYESLEKEINEGLLKSGIIEVRNYRDETLKRDKKADMGRINKLLGEAEKELNTYEEIDLYRQVKALVFRLPKKMQVK